MFAAKTGHAEHLARFAIASLALPLAACGGHQGPATTSITEEQPVSSSASRYHVVAMKHDATTKALHVRLASGIYRYSGVPKELADRFAASADQDGFYLTELHERFGETYLSTTTPGYQDIGL